MQKRIDLQIKNDSSIKLEKKSLEIYENKVKKELKILFNMLDSDKDGKISYEDLNNENLSIKLRDVLKEYKKHLFCEKKQNFEKFYEKMCKKLKEFSCYEKNIILNEKKIFKKIKSPHFQVKFY